METGRTSWEVRGDGGSGGMLEAAFWYLCAGSGPHFTEEKTKVQRGQEALQSREPGTALEPNLSPWPPGLAQPSEGFLVLLSWLLVPSWCLAGCLVVALQPRNQNQSFLPSFLLSFHPLVLPPFLPGPPVGRDHLPGVQRICLQAKHHLFIPADPSHWSVLSKLLLPPWRLRLKKMKSGSNSLGSSFKVVQEEVLTTMLPQRDPGGARSPQEDQEALGLPRYPKTLNMGLRAEVQQSGPAWVLEGSGRASVATSHSCS